MDGAARAACRVSVSERRLRISEHLQGIWRRRTPGAVLPAALCGCLRGARATGRRLADPLPCDQPDPAPRVRVDCVLADMATLRFPSRRNYRLRRVPLEPAPARSRLVGVRTA